MVIADVVPSTAATTSGHKVIGAKPAQPIKDGRSVGVEDRANSLHDRVKHLFGGRLRKGQLS
jgi:hypothetical protein